MQHLSYFIKNNASNLFLKAGSKMEFQCTIKIKNFARHKYFVFSSQLIFSLPGGSPDKKKPE